MRAASDTSGRPPRRRRRRSLRAVFRAATGGGCGGASLMGFVALGSMVGFLVFLGPAGAVLWVGALIALAVLIVRQQKRRRSGGTGTGRRSGRG